MGKWRLQVRQGRQWEINITQYFFIGEQTKFLSHIVWMWRDPDKKAKQIVQLATYTIVK